MKEKLDNFLHRNAGVADAILKKIQRAERERKDLQGIRKLARERAKKSSLHNKKLRDCRAHLSDSKAAAKGDRRLETTLFITEGDSASGSITKSRDVNTQAVFSLKVKPLNSFASKVPNTSSGNINDAFEHQSPTAFNFFAASSSAVYIPVQCKLFSRSLIN